MATCKMVEALESAQVDVGLSSFSPQAESLPLAAIRLERDVADLKVSLEEVHEANQDAPVEVGPSISSRLWTKEEDEKLIAQVNVNGAKNWFIIAEVVPGRTGKSCRDRWLNHLDPTVNKEPWTEEEETILMKAQQTYGNKWAKISSLLPGRTSLAIKNRWYGSLRKKRCHGFQQQYKASPQIPRTLGPASNEIPDMRMPTGKRAEALEGAQIDVGPSRISPQAESLPPAAIQYERDIPGLNVPLEEVDETNQDASVEVGPGISSRLWTKEEDEKLIARVNVGLYSLHPPHQSTSNSASQPEYFLPATDPESNLPDMNMATGKMAEALESAQVDVGLSSFSPQAESLPLAAIRLERDVADLKVSLEEVHEANQDAPVEVGPSISSRLWTKEEDEKLIAQVNVNGAKNWFIIAEVVPGRTGKSCRDRWLNHLDPTVNKEPWTEEEETILMKAQQTYGNKWAKISSLLPGRTSLAIKNRWYGSSRKKRCHGFQQQYKASPQIPRTLGPASNEIPVSHCSNNGPVLLRRSLESTLKVAAENFIIHPLEESPDVDIDTSKLED